MAIPDNDGRIMAAVVLPARLFATVLILKRVVHRGRYALLRQFFVA